jgi:hypothetical protein
MGSAEGQTETSGGIFRVGYHQVELVLFAQSRQQFLNGLPPGFAYDITYNQDCIL